MNTLLNATKYTVYFNVSRYSSSIAANKVIYDKNANFINQDLDYGDKQLSFQDACKIRKQQAKRSVLIKYEMGSHLQDVIRHCSRYGSIENVICFQELKKFDEMAIVEFKDYSSVIKLIEKGAMPFMQKETHFTFPSHFLYYDSQRSSRGRSTAPALSSVRVKHVLRHPCDGEDLLRSELLNATTVSEQISRLYELLAVKDGGARLRYFVVSEMEELLLRVYPQCRVAPFGSSVNGFGKFDCDLDLTINVLDLAPRRHEDRPFRFMTNRRDDASHAYQASCVSVLGGLAGLLLPHCRVVSRILNARVPIIKLHHHGTNLDCDVTYQGQSAIQMSELLYECAQRSASLRPLVFAVRSWACVVGIKQNSAGPWPSNFTLTLLVMYFLQSRTQPLLCPVSHLFSYSHNKPATAAPANVPQGDDSSQTLGNLLEDFFSFYAVFDFHTTAISVISGKAFKKLDEQQAMYIENPLETELNVSKNVSQEHVDKFQLACKHACNVLQSSVSRTGSSNWGLLRLLEDENTGAVLSKIFRSTDDNRQLAGENKADSVAGKSGAAETKSEDSLLSRADLSRIFSDSNETISNATSVKV